MGNNFREKAAALRRGAEGPALDLYIIDLMIKPAFDLDAEAADAESVAAIQKGLGFPEDGSETISGVLDEQANRRG